MTEAELRQWDSNHRLSVIGAVLWIRGDLRYWPAPESTPTDVLGLDVQGECEAVAAEVSRRFGYRLVAGWVAASGHPGQAVGHCWNLDSAGLPVDAAASRIRPVSYLGALVPSAWVSRLAQYSPYPPAHLRADVR